MAKKPAKSNLDLWLDKQREENPDAVEHFETLLNRWNIPTVGAAFAQFNESFEPISIYLRANSAPATTKAIEPIKSCLEIAFRRSQAISNELACTPGIYNTVVNKPVPARR